MSPQDYERLLVAAHLAHFHKKWGFSIKKVNWNLFVEGHRFRMTTNCTGTFEVDAKKLDINACINWVSPKHRLAFASAITAVVVFIVSIVVGPAAANAAVAFSASALAAVTAVAAVTTVAAVVAAAVAAATTIAATTAVVDCYVFVTPLLAIQDHFTLNRPLRYYYRPIAGASSRFWRRSRKGIPLVRATAKPES
jgi:hypothetical protein